MISSYAESQTKRIEDAIWWEIAEKCFKETGIQNHNTLFLDIKNTHFAGSIYKKRLNSVGRMLHPIILFDYEGVAKQIPNYPKPDYKEITTHCSFKIEDTKEHQKELVSKVLQEANFPKTAPKIFALLSNSVGTELIFIQWGTCEISKDDFENCLQENKKTKFAKMTRNGERYLTLKSIWMESIGIQFDVEESNKSKLQKLYQENKDNLNNSGIKLEESKLVITFKEKRYPFAILGEITKIMGFKSFNGIVIKPDFNRYNNLIKYQTK